MTIFYDNFLLQILMKVSYDNFWWQFLLQFLMTIFYDNFRWQFLWPDTWHLRHWSHCWQLRTTTLTTIHKTTTLRDESALWILLQDFLTSEVKTKWLQWLMLTPPWPPSAWIFAKHWPTRARPSTFPWPSPLGSPSPWTPGKRQPAQTSRKRQAPPPLGEMLSGKRNTWSKQAKPFNSESRWRSGSCFQCAFLWSMWLQIRLWKGAEATQEDEACTFQ